MPNIAPFWVDRRRKTAEVARAVVVSSQFSSSADRFVPDSRQAWFRLVVAVLIAAVGAVGMWSVVVVMPVVQALLKLTAGLTPWPAGGTVVEQLRDQESLCVASPVAVTVTVLLVSSATGTVNAVLAPDATVKGWSAPS